jgi:lipopolysaccharide biosynthesis glycosyltransferase
MFNICFACDDKYFELLMVAIHSIQKTNDKIMFIICYNSENDSHFDSIRQLIESEGNIVDFIGIERVLSLLPTNLRQHSYITIETYIRLLLPVLINTDHVLYLDPDLIVRKNISLLFHSYAIGGLAAVPYNPNLKWIASRNELIGLTANHPYFNAGVLLLNLKKLRETNLFQQVLDYLKINPDSNDQDALNIVFADKYTKLDNKYNWTLHDLRSNIDPVIVHFAGPHKPNIKFFTHPYAREFNKHYREIFPNKRYQVSYSYLRIHFFKALIKKILFNLANYLNTFRRT